MEMSEPLTIRLNTSPTLEEVVMVITPFCPERRAGAVGSCATATLARSVASRI